MISRIRILRASGVQLSKLEDEINWYINDGWQPVGELKVIRVDKSDILIQQMAYTPEVDTTT